MDSKYAFATLHIHSAIYEERGLLTAGGKEIKSKDEILQLLEAVWEPTEVLVIHCKGHQKGNDPVSRGNRLADQAMQEAASQSGHARDYGTIAKVLLAPKLPTPPRYS